MDTPPVQYVTTSDGYDIAYTMCGTGQVLVDVPAVFSHVEVYWNRHSWYRPWLHAFASRFTLVRFDGRGQGLSTRGLPQDLSIGDLYRDLEQLLTRLRLASVILVAHEHTGHLALRYAVNHPERVRALILGTVSTANHVWSNSMFEGLAVDNWEAFLLTMGAVGGTHTEAAETLARLGRPSLRQTSWSECGLSARPTLRSCCLAFKLRHSSCTPVALSRCPQASR
jgi:pimeloyl-ACP methyl ester carboxylesterase